MEETGSPSPVAIEITAATAEELQSGFASKQLRAYNTSVLGEYPELKTVHLNARDSAGKVIGTLRSIVALRWLRVEVLWVDEAVRHHGVGSRLLAEAERQAFALGARKAALETFEFQAPLFYEKHGYREVGRINDYAKGYYLATMAKSLGQ
jgi:ribosomal protein S18 acetylase RimI-like enzyme